jgi:hypothetical protein
MTIVATGRLSLRVLEMCSNSCIPRALELLHSAAQEPVRSNTWLFTAATRDEEGVQCSLIFSRPGLIQGAIATVADEHARVNCMCAGRATDRWQGIWCWSVRRFTGWVRQEAVDTIQLALVVRPAYVYAKSITSAQCGVHCCHILSMLLGTHAWIACGYDVLGPCTQPLQAATSIKPTRPWVLYCAVPCCAVLSRPQAFWPAVIGLLVTRGGCKESSSIMRILRMQRVWHRVVEIGWRLDRRGLQVGQQEAALAD